MTNPGGNYPGRQIWAGALFTGQPAFAYFGSGRSQKSQQRYATPYDEREHAIRIKQADPAEQFDPFRHYQAVGIDPESGLVVISNSQAPNDVVFEVYKFRHASKTIPRFRFTRILATIGPENDNLENPTPRIMCVIVPRAPEIVEGRERRYIDAHFGITTEMEKAYVVVAPQVYGGLYHVQTYNGEVDYKSSDPMELYRRLESSIFHRIRAQTAQELADEIYDMSDYVDPTYGELRVWCVAGVRNDNGPGGWELARRNRFEVE